MDNEIEYFDHLLAALVDSTRSIKLRDLTALSSLDDDSLAAFREAWSAMSTDRRRWLVQQLIDLAEDDATLDFNAFFLTALDDQDSQVRIAAIHGLWEYEGRDLEARLKSIMKSDADSVVRTEAALALGRFVLLGEFGSLPEGAYREILALLRETINDEDEEVLVRAAALEAIGSSSEEWVKDEIRKAYEDEDDQLRLGAVRAMGENCDSVWLPALFDELASPDAEMRFDAATACGTIGAGEAVPYLKPLLEDEDGEVRAAAISALGQIGGSEAKALLLQRLHRPDEPLRDIIEDAIAEMDFASDPLAFRFRG